MKKVLIIASIAAMTLAGCAQSLDVVDEAAVQQELSVMSIAEKGTKGYTQGTLFYETLVENLHSTDTAKKDNISRDMYISAYMYTQEGGEEDYFVGKIFHEDPEKHIWRNYTGNAFDPIYWPLGSKLDFLAISQTSEEAYQFSAADMEWKEGNAASSVKISVEANATQNDILFSSASKIASSTGSNAVAMVFNHAQAWIEFILKSNVDEVVKINSITINDVYNAGELTVNNNNGSAQAIWDFRKETASNIAVWSANATSSTGVSYDGGFLDANGVYFDMLIPEQTKTSFTIKYTLGNVDKELSYTYDLKHNNWLMGCKYIYSISMNANEITVAPTVVAWATGDVSDIEGNLY